MYFPKEVEILEIIEIFMLVAFTKIELEISLFHNV